MPNSSSLVISLIVLSFMFCIRLSSSIYQANEVNITSPENQNRIKSKHQEMWNIISSIVERKETLEKFSQGHDLETSTFSEKNLTNFPNWGLYYLGNNYDEDKTRTRLSYIEQNYDFNIVMSKLLVKEMRKLSKLERECQNYIRLKPL